jgi:DNA-binding beta-propeller fold protein YncE
MFSITGSLLPKVEFLSVADQTIGGLALGNPQCLAINSNREEFLVADAANDRVVIFDSTGTVAFSFALGDGRHNPFGIVVNGREEIIVGAMDISELWIYDYTGEYQNTIALPNDVYPGRLVCDAEDRIIIANRAGNDIVILDSDGSVAMRFIATGPCKPSGIAFDKDGNLTLVSSEGTVMTGFNHDGKIIFSTGEHGRKLEDFSHPAGLAVDDAGGIWVVDTFRHHIKRFGADRKFVDIFGTRGGGNGEFYFPADIKISPKGRLAVLEKGSGRIQIFKLDYAK